MVILPDSLSAGRLKIKTVRLFLGMLCLFAVLAVCATVQTIKSYTNTIPVKESNQLKKFKRRFTRVKPGMNKQRVLNLLKEPHDIVIAVLPEPPFWGPQESLVNIINPGTQYEQWRYVVARTDFLIFFGSADKIPRKEWKVLDKTYYSNNEVF
jgi:hypothetical protein